MMRPGSVRCATCDNSDTGMTIDLDCRTNHRHICGRALRNRWSRHHYVNHFGYPILAAAQKGKIARDTVSTAGASRTALMTPRAFPERHAGSRAPAWSAASVPRGEGESFQVLSRCASRLHRG